MGYSKKKEITTLFCHTSCVESVCFSSDGKILASGSNDAMTKLWDMETKQEITTLTGHDNCIISVCFSPNGRLLASGSYDNTIKIWDTVTFKELTTLIYTDWISSVCFQPEQYEYLLK